MVAKNLVSAIIVTLLIIVSGIPSLISPVAAQKEKVTLVLAYGNDVDSMNPLVATATAAWILNGLVYSSSLGYVFNNGTIAPWLAERWEVSPDAKVFTFYLRKNVKWHDGTPFTSADVRFTFEMAKKYADRIANPTYTQAILYLESVETPDDYTVVFKLNKSLVSFLFYAATAWILPKHIWEKLEDPVAYPNEHPIGLGPYKFVSRTPGVKFVLEAYDDFFLGRPAVDQIIYMIIKNPEARILALKKGEIDATTIDPTDVGALVGEENIKVIKYPSIATATVLGYNMRKYPFTVREFRHVIDYLIDKEALVKNVQFGFAEIGSNGYIQPSWKEWIHPDAPFWHGKGLTEEERIKKAEEILDKLGFIDRDGDGVRETPNGTKLEFELWTLAEYSDYISAAQFVKQSLETVGIKINIVPMATQTVIQRVYYGPPFEYDMYFMGIGYLPDPDAVLYLEFFGNPPIYGWTAYAQGYNNETLNELLLKQQSEGDFEKRREIVWKIQEILADDLPVIVLYHSYALAARRTDRFIGWIDEEGVYSPLVIINLKPKPSETTPTVTTVTTVVTPTTIVTTSVKTQVVTQTVSGEVQTITKVETVTYTTTATTPYPTTITTTAPPPQDYTTIVLGVLVVILLIAVVALLVRRRG